MPHIEVKPCRAAHSPRHTGGARAAGGLRGPTSPLWSTFTLCSRVAAQQTGGPLSLSPDVHSRVVYNIRPKAIGSLGT